MIQILICSISYTFQPDLVWKVKARRMVYRRVKHCGQWRKWPTTHTRIMWSRDASQRLWKLNWILILSCLSRLPYRLIISNHLCPSHIQRRMNSMVLSSRLVRHKSHGATSLSRSAWQLAIALWSESTTLMRGCCIHALYRKSSKRYLEKLLKSSPSRWVGMHSSYLRRMKRW